MKRFLVIAVCISCGAGGKPSARAQAAAGVTVETHVVDEVSSAFVLKSPDGVEQAMISLMRSDGDLIANVDFATLDRTFEVRYPGGTSIDELLDSFTRNAVLVHGHAELAGLERYCAERHIVLKETAKMYERMRAAGHRQDCRECSEDFRACQVRKSEERRYPASGVTYENASSSCEAQYRVCSFHGVAAEAMRKPDEWPCGPTPQ